MAKQTQRTELIRTLLETAQYPGGLLESEGPPSGPRAAAARELSLVVSGVEITAWITSDVTLAMSVRAREWNEGIEREVYDALDADPSLVAGLLLWEWSEVRAACAAAAATRVGARVGTSAA